MNRYDLQIDNTKIIAYCKREHRMQLRVYEDLVAKQKMTKYQANLNFSVIRELSEVAEILEKRKITWSDFRKMLDKLPVQTRGKQGELELL